MFLYNSIYEYGEAEYIVEKSRFIAHAMPVESLEEAKALVESQPSFTISVPESLASFVQARLEKAGATVTRQS